jgi:ATP-dependent exoDNAse (exonuclease V) alpha subunit
VSDERYYPSREFQVPIQPRARARRDCPKTSEIVVAAESQVAAIRIALISKVLVMTGGPGVGKTTIVKAILRILAAKGTNLLLCAPSRRQAHDRGDWL